MKYCFWSLILIVLILAILSSCTKDMPSHIVAEVDGDSITVTEFTSEFFPMVKGYTTSSLPQEEETLRNLKEALLDQLIEKRLILHEAPKMGITVSDYELEEALASIKRGFPEGEFEEVVQDEATLLQWKERLHQRLLIEKVINRVSQITSPIDEKTMKQYYEKHREQFVLTEQVRVRQIVVKDRKDAERILSKLKRGDPFDELARKYSSGLEAKEGGDLGFFGQGEMPEEFDVVFSLQAGEISDIVQSPYGYHIFQVVAKQERSESGFAEVKDQIRQLIMHEEEEKAFHDWLETVKKRASIRVNRKALEGIELPAPRGDENKEMQEELDIN
jgi:peptidyl-prolyl cis-trans isomerase C